MATMPKSISSLYNLIRNNYPNIKIKKTSNDIANEAYEIISTFASEKYNYESNCKSQLKINQQKIDDLEKQILFLEKELSICKESSTVEIIENILSHFKFNSGFSSIRISFDNFYKIWSTFVEVNNVKYLLPYYEPTVRIEQSFNKSLLQALTDLIRRPKVEEDK